MTGIVTLTTDFGPGGYVGAMKGAILSIDSELTIVDLDHNVRPHDVRHGAFVLYSAVPYFPFASTLAAATPEAGRSAGASLAVARAPLRAGRPTERLVPRPDELDRTQAGRSR